MENQRRGKSHPAQVVRKSVKEDVIDLSPAFIHSFINVHPTNVY